MSWLWSVVILIGLTIQLKQVLLSFMYRGIGLDFLKLTHGLWGKLCNILCLTSSWPYDNSN